jgi:hypothetical protein
VKVPRCKYFDSCAAPLCQDDDESLYEGVWYIGEEICRRRGVEFVSRQRRISRVVADRETCYTASMLKRDIAVTKTLMGIDPERDRELALENWFRHHRGKTPLSEDEKARRREAFLICRMAPVPAKPSSARAQISAVSAGRGFVRTKDSVGESGRADGPPARDGTDGISCFIGTGTTGSRMDTEGA